jgi:ATP-binding cassette subfamily B protein
MSDSRIAHQVWGNIPESVRGEAAAAGLVASDVLFGVCADLNLSGDPAEVWVMVTGHRIVALESGRPSTNPPSFELERIEKIRAFQTIGNVFLQVALKDSGVFIDVARYSNARREIFGRARIQINRLLKGQEFQKEGFAKPGEQICDHCGLPLVAAGTSCPRCSARRGVFMRSAGLMAPYATKIAVLLAMMVMGVLLDLAPPQLTRMLVDKVLMPRHNASWLPWILLGLCSIAAGRCFLNVMIGRSSSSIGTRITRELRERLQAKLLSLSVDYYDRHSAGSLMSRVLYDVDYFQSFVVQVSQGFLLNLMLVVGIGATLFAMNWRLATLVLLPVPIVIVGTMFFWKHIYPRYYKLWDSQSKMAQSLTGLVQGIRLVKAFGQEEREKQRFSGSATYVQDSRRSVEMSVSTFNPIMAFVFSLGGLIVWYAGGQQVLGRSISLGTLMAFFGYLGMFYAPISALSVFSNWVTGFLSAGQRVFEVLDANSSLHDSGKRIRMPAMKGHIQFVDVTFGYDPYNPILKNVSLTIEPGQFVGVVGKSGSGKTTLVNLICRFYDVQQGQILIDGVDVRDIATEDLHRQTALVLQEPFLFRASIWENLTYGHHDADPVVVINAAKAAAAHDFIVRRATAYDTQLGERGAGLSGGERQRVSIARALLCDPRILILDEATSSVDTESEQEIQQALAVAGRGRTTIAIAHRLSTLKNADRIYVVDNGTVAESGTHDELIALGGIYHKLVRIQTELARLEGH